MRRQSGRSWSPMFITKHGPAIAASSAPFAPGSRANSASGLPARSPSVSSRSARLVDTGQPLATLDEVDLKLQAEQADAEFSAATGVLAQASAAESRTKELQQKGWSTDAQLDQAKAAADEARAQAQTRRALGRADEEQPVLRDAGRRRSRRRHRDIDRARSGGGRRSDRDPRCAAGREGGCRRDPGNAAGDAPSPARRGSRCGRSRTRSMSPSSASSRRRPIPMTRTYLAKFSHARRWRRCATRHDRDADLVRARDRTRGAAAVVGAVQPGRRAVGSMSPTTRPARSRSSR